MCPRVEYLFTLLDYLIEIQDVCEMDMDDDIIETVDALKELLID